VWEGKKRRAIFPGLKVQCRVVLEERIREEREKFLSNLIQYYGRIVHKNYVASHCKWDRERVNWSYRMNNK
jgi:hypothetical protein